MDGQDADVYAGGSARTIRAASTPLRTLSCGRSFARRRFASATSSGRASRSQSSWPARATAPTAGCAGYHRGACRPDRSPLPLPLREKGESRTLGPRAERSIGDRIVETMQEAIAKRDRKKR